MIHSIVGLFLIGAMASAETLRTYEGLDKGRPCFLYVHQENDEARGYQVEISTSYEHAGQGLGRVTLKFASDSNGKILDWQNTETKEFVRVLLKNPNQSLQEPVVFRLKWIHFDHLHDSTCSDLKPAGEQ